MNKNLIYFRIFLLIIAILLLILKDYIFLKILPSGPCPIPYILYIIPSAFLYIILIILLVITGLKLMIKD
jgi:hypothetical protein